MLTPKGRAYALLVKVRNEWDSFTPAQREEAAELVDRLSKALRNEDPKPRRPMQMVGRISA